ncbi:conserved hypothetical protein [Vibrio nigripulchritudo FTn2]|uniref:hypothetical protein n=1 Tax=Vibrio nigripulchritudo TaxID=28173 RepID=UPI0003B1E734|nr:hypothetical protein [Vibrio nigripulchritudo]CCN40141.1 conserved hypothetical protein [Vibrio nigripulchritudo FTn2]
MSSPIIPKPTIDSLIKLARKTMSEDYQRAIQGKVKLWQWWGEDMQHLRQNCLPAHLAIINQVKTLNLGPNPAVVIGELLDANKELSAKEIALIKNKSVSGPGVHDNYHAWIVLDVSDSQSDIIDITGHHFKGVQVPEHYMNNAIAAREGLRHQPVLTEESDVYSYHANLVKAQVSTGTTEQNRKELIGYLRKFAALQGISEEIALGAVGREALMPTESKGIRSTLKKIRDCLFSRTK